MVPYTNSNISKGVLLLQVDAGVDVAFARITWGFGISLVSTKGSLWQNMGSWHRKALTKLLSATIARAEENMKLDLEAALDSDKTCSAL